MRSLLFLACLGACGGPKPAEPITAADRVDTANVAGATEPATPIENRPHVTLGGDGIPQADGTPAVTRSGSLALFLHVESNPQGKPTAAWISTVDLTKGYVREEQHGKIELTFDGSGRDVAVAKLDETLGSQVTEEVVPLTTVTSTGAWSEFADQRFHVEQLGDNPEDAVVKVSIDGATAFEGKAPWLSPRMPGYTADCTDGVEIMDVAYSLEAKVALLYVDVDGTGCRGAWGIYPIKWK